MHYKSFADLASDVRGWGELGEQRPDLIVGVPRSGLMVASLVATFQNVPLIDIDGYLAGSAPWLGRTRDLLRHIDQSVLRSSHKAQSVLVLEDSVQSGKSIAEVKGSIENNGLGPGVVYASVYVAPGAEKHVDLFFEVMDTPAAFEWNLFHHPIMESACIDLDGVLCREPRGLEESEGAKYEAFLTQSPPLVRPSKKIGCLVTSRGEKYRAATEDWLSRSSIDYGQLFMREDMAAAHDGQEETVSSFKADIFRKAEAEIFIERSAAQAEEIADQSGRPVLAYDIGQVVWPHGARRWAAQTRATFWYGKWKERIPKPVRRLGKFLLGRRKNVRAQS